MFMQMFIDVYRIYRIYRIYFQLFAVKTDLGKNWSRISGEERIETPLGSSFMIGPLALDPG